MDSRGASNSGLLPGSFSNKISQSAYSPPKRPPLFPDSHVKQIELLVKVKSLEQQLSSKELQSAQMREHYMQEIGRLSSEVAQLEVKLKTAESKLLSDNTTIPFRAITSQPEPCSKCFERERNYSHTVERAAINEKNSAERIAKLEEELLLSNNQLVSHKSRLNSLSADLTTRAARIEQLEGRLRTAGADQFELEKLQLKCAQLEAQLAKYDPAELIPEKLVKLQHLEIECKRLRSENETYRSTRENIELYRHENESLREKTKRITVLEVENAALAEKVEAQRREIEEVVSFASSLASSSNSGGSSASVSPLRGGGGSIGRLRVMLADHVRLQREHALLLDEKNRALSLLTTREAELCEKERRVQEVEARVVEAAREKDEFASQALRYKKKFELSELEIKSLQELIASYKEECTVRITREPAKMHQMTSSGASPFVESSSPLTSFSSSEITLQKLESYKTMVAELERQLEAAHTELANLRSLSIASKVSSSATTTGSLSVANASSRSLSEPALLLHLREQIAELEKRLEVVQKEKAELEEKVGILEQQGAFDPRSTRVVRLAFSNPFDRAQQVENKRLEEEARKVAELQQLTDTQVAKENLDLKSKLESNEKELKRLSELMKRQAASYQKSARHYRGLVRELLGFRIEPRHKRSNPEAGEQLVDPVASEFHLRSVYSESDEDYIAIAVGEDALQQKREHTANTTASALSSGVEVLWSQFSERSDIAALVEKYLSNPMDTTQLTGAGMDTSRIGANRSIRIFGTKLPLFSAIVPSYLIAALQIHLYQRRREQQLGRGGPTLANARLSRQGSEDSRLSGLSLSSLSSHASSHHRQHQQAHVATSSLAVGAEVADPGTHLDSIFEDEPTQLQPSPLPTSLAPAQIGTTPAVAPAVPAPNPLALIPSLFVPPLTGTNSSQNDYTFSNSHVGLLPLLPPPSEHIELHGPAVSWLPQATLEALPVAPSGDVIQMLMPVSLSRPSSQQSSHSSASGSYMSGEDAGTESDVESLHVAEEQDEAESDMDSEEGGGSQSTGAADTTLRPTSSRSQASAITVQSEDTHESPNGRLDDGPAAKRSRRLLPMSAVSETFYEDDVSEADAEAEHQETLRLARSLASQGGESLAAGSQEEGEFSTTTPDPQGQPPEEEQEQEYASEAESEPVSGEYDEEEQAEEEEEEETLEEEYLEDEYEQLQGDEGMMVPEEDEGNEHQRLPARGFPAAPARSAETIEISSDSEDA